MTMHTSATGEKLLEELARVFDAYASDCEAFAARGMNKRQNKTDAKVWREAAETCRDIRIVSEEAAE